MIGIVARHWFVKGLRFFDNVLWIVLCSSLGCNPHLYLTFWLEHPPPHPSSYPISLSRGFPGSIPTTVGSRWGANRGHVLVLQPSVLSGRVSELLQWVLEKARPSMMVFSVRLVLQVDVNIYLIHLSWTFILIFWLMEVEAVGAAFPPLLFLFPSIISTLTAKWGFCLCDPCLCLISDVGAGFALLLIVTPPPPSGFFCTPPPPLSVS